MVCRNNRTNYTIRPSYLTQLKTASLLGFYIKTNNNKNPHIKIKPNQLRTFPTTKFICNKDLLKEQESEIRLQKSTAKAENPQLFHAALRAVVGLQAVGWHRRHLSRGISLRLNELMCEKHQDQRLMWSVIQPLAVSGIFTSELRSLSCSA